MSHSKPVPPFVFDSLYYLNRDQLERLSIVCCSIKNFIGRYLNSKPYRVFDQLNICGGSYALAHNRVRWYPNRDDYTVRQFFNGQKCSAVKPWNAYNYYFGEMRPYLGPTVRIKSTTILVGVSIFNLEHITEIESISYLWRDACINIMLDGDDDMDYTSQIDAEDFQLILNSPTILQCRHLMMDNAHFSFKDYKVLYAVNTIDVDYYNEKIDPEYWPQFLEQPGVKPIVVLRLLHRESVANVLDSLSKAFTSAFSPNAFKIVFAEFDEKLTEFKQTNKTSAEILELKK